MAKDLCADYRRCPITSADAQATVTTTPTAGLTVARSVIVVGCARRVITAMKDGPSHATEPPKRSTASSVRVSPKAATPRSTRTARPPEPPESSSRTAHRPTTVVDSTRLRSIPPRRSKDNKYLSTFTTHGRPSSRPGCRFSPTLVHRRCGVVIFRDYVSILTRETAYVSRPQSDDEVEQTKPCCADH